MDDFATPGTPNGFGLFPSPCEFHIGPPIDLAHYHAVNYPEPGKRPLSSTVPMIMENEDGTFYLAVGGSGGSRIFPAVFQVILNLDWGMDVSGAIEYGRLHDQLYPTILDADDIIPTETLDVLREKGHNVTGGVFNDRVLFSCPLMRQSVFLQSLTSTVSHQWYKQSRCGTTRSTVSS